jgi:hypothetical protein
MPIISVAVIGSPTSIKPSVAVSITFARGGAEYGAGLTSRRAISSTTPWGVARSTLGATIRSLAPADASASRAAPVALARRRFDIRVQGAALPILKIEIGWLPHWYLA